MMETADLRNADDSSLCRPLHRLRLGRIFHRSEMTTTVMVIIEKQSEMVRQAGLVENDDVVQALPANRADHHSNIRNRTSYFVLNRSG